jgi:hypothetical protein
MVRVRLNGTVVFLPFTSVGHWASTVISSGAVIFAGTGVTWGVGVGGAG